MRTLVNAFTLTDDFPFWIQRNRHDRTNLPDLHGHEFVELIFVVDGVAMHRFQDGAYEIRAGDVFVINPGEVHGYSCEEGQYVDIINCVFQPGLLHERLLRELDMTDAMDFFYVEPFLHPDSRFHHRLNVRGEAAEQMLYMLNSMLQELQQRERGYQTCIRLHMIQLFVLLSRCFAARKEGQTTYRSRERIVQRVCGYLERHFDQKITLALLSELFHIGERQLNRQFNRVTGTSVIAYLHRIRIEKAKRMLVETDATMTTIAAAVGYEDHAFFSTLFARLVGDSPGKYRDKHQDIDSRSHTDEP